MSLKEIKYFLKNAKEKNITLNGTRQKYAAKRPLIQSKSINI
jgi:hypothetical protein